MIKTTHRVTVRSHLWSLFQTWGNPSKPEVLERRPLGARLMQVTFLTALEVVWGVLTDHDRPWSCWGVGAKAPWSSLDAGNLPHSPIFCLCKQRTHIIPHNSTSQWLENQLNLGVFLSVIMLCWWLQELLAYAIQDIYSFMELGFSPIVWLCNRRITFTLHYLENHLDSEVFLVMERPIVWFCNWTITFNIGDPHLSD